MPCVLLIQTRKSIDRPFQRIRLAHIPVGRQLLSVWIRVDEKNDVVTQDAERLRVAAADQLIRGFNELLRSQHLVGVKAAVNPDDDLPFRGERLRLIGGQPVGVREALRDPLVAIERTEILGRCDNGHPLRAPFLGSADVNKRQAIRFGVQLFPVRFDLRIVRKEVVVADAGAKLLFRSRDA